MCANFNINRVILWTALSVALGVEIRGEIFQAVPCIKRANQTYCSTPGNNYPMAQIQQFIDENMGLIKRMHGDYQMNTKATPGPGGRKTKRNARIKPGVPDLHADPEIEPEYLNLGGENFFANIRKTRQSPMNQSSNKLDACEANKETVSPFWASNSAGKTLAIVNTQHLEQAIYQEVCSQAQTSRCSASCGCEQKYGWQRLLAYDPDDNCKGIFMDWFMFPSCCVCRCDPT